MAVNESFDDYFDLTDWRRPPAELKVVSGLNTKNPLGTIYEINSVLNTNKCPKFFKTGSLCTCIKWYKSFGIIWSLSAWLKWNYFNAMIISS